MISILNKFGKFRNRII